jgi:hypothetical protein
MTAKPEDFLLQAWKQQLDLGLRLVETMVDGAIKLREVQIKAAGDWTRANAEKCAAYWRELYEVAASSQAKVASRTKAHPPAATQKFHRIPIGTLPKDRAGAEPAPAKRKPSRRAHAPAAK